MSAASRARRLGLRALRVAASSTLVERLGGTKRLEGVVRRASSQGFSAAARANRLWRSARRGAAPARQHKATPPDLFDLRPTEEQRLLAEAVKELAISVVRPQAKEADRLGRVPAEVAEKVAELGLTALALPEEYGGPLAERSAVTALLAYEALAYGDLGIAAAHLGGAAVPTALALWGTGEQQSRYLEPFGSAQPPPTALALLERQPAFDPLAPAATARPVAGGWVLEGQKALVLGGVDADLYLVAARRAEGPALFLVEGSTKGLRRKADPAMGLRAAATAIVSLERVTVGQDALLGEGDPALYRECVARARLGWCALALGCCQAVLDYVIPYVKERKAFGEPIANRQAVAFAVANIAIELEGMRLATLRAASLADQGKPFEREAGLARLLCAKHGMAIGSAGVQLLGGHGYVKEHPVERWYRDLRAIGLMEGGLLV